MESIPLRLSVFFVRSFDMLTWTPWPLWKRRRRMTRRMNIHKSGSRRADTTATLCTTMLIKRHRIVLFIMWSVGVKTDILTEYVYNEVSIIVYFCSYYFYPL
ncbi:hypothetical protein LINPERPRIM_LOCUS29890 [Linum perenne]